MCNKWLDEVFLPSLFEKAGVNRFMWLTVKQSEIIKRYFRSKCTTTDNGQNLQRVYSKIYNWQEREVNFFGSSNGAGRIIFGTNETENKAIAEHEEKKEIERFYRHVKVYNKRFPEKLIEELNNLKESVKYALEDLAEITDITEIEWLEKQIAIKNEKITIIEKVI